MRYLLTCLIAFTLVAPVQAEEENKDGRVSLPLAQYNLLVDASRDPKQTPRDAPAPYALGQANVRATVSETGEKSAVAEVSVELSIKVLEDDWVLVPILPSGTPVSSASVAGRTVELIPTADGLSWGVKDAGSYQMHLKYDIDAQRSEMGFALPLPVPQAASINLQATLPGTGLDATVIPSAGTRITVAGSSTNVKATIPTTKGVQLSWRTPNLEGYALSRAKYKGTLDDEAVSWTGDFQVELHNDETITLKLLPSSVTLSDISVDGKNGSIITEDGYFATYVKGRGLHEVKVSFEVPVSRNSGPPSINIQIPQIPVSRFDLSLPGKKEIAVSPFANVSHKESDQRTTATVFVPMTSNVRFSWSEAVPEEIKQEVRANAEVFHIVHAEEGVLYVQAKLNYQITRGETNLVALEIPDSVQINGISSPNGGVADWRVQGGKEGKPRQLEIFLDRKVKDKIAFDISYDQSILGEEAKERISVPLLRANDVHRQRGMVALLSSKEFALKPVEEEQVNRVGENQLPHFIRQGIEKTIAHTYKYVELSPTLVVKATAPERKQGKFDAQVNTLISVGDVTMTGAATIEVNVKSGKISDLQLDLPPNVNFLSLTGPSLRSHKVQSDGDLPFVDVQFTQEMEGQFRLEASYERIMAAKQDNADVPTLLVRGAEVEQGRIAIEALSAVEVESSVTEQLSTLDPNELPQQLVLKTTNPILLAYKYVQVDKPYKLALKITRHREIEVQSAAIDRAHYKTLYTMDGLAVTTALFTVRNSRAQFLKVQLPENSKVWSAFVDGKPEKPALAEGAKKGAGPNVLIKIINSVQGFPVHLIYQTPVSKVGPLGVLDGDLPRPEMVATHTHWDVYLPDELSYGRPTTNMKLIGKGVRLSPELMRSEVAKIAPPHGAGGVGPLHISVPTAGVRYSFEKLYANQAEENANFSIPYVSGVGSAISMVLVLLGTALMWIGMYFLARKESKFSSTAALGMSALGVAILIVALGYFGVSYIPALSLSVLFAIGILLQLVQAQRAR